MINKIKSPVKTHVEKNKGKKTKNALLLGMWSHHMKGSGEYLAMVAATNRTIYSPCNIKKA
jgi:hypothetical protein